MSMIQRNTRKILLTGIFLLLIFIQAVIAQSSSIPGLENYVLSNGLEVFLYENHSVPLVRIQITFRCGAISQTPETAGLFHLYEHMLFKGNKQYTNQTEFNSAMHQLGISNYNGGTAPEYVTYYFTIPSSKVEQGIQFWAHAVRFPLFNEAEFEAEKQVVLTELANIDNDHDTIFTRSIEKNLFYKYPYRKDVAGTEHVIKNATISMMSEMQQRFFVPNNAALFVSGDICPAYAEKFVSEYFEAWAPSDNPWEDQIKPHPYLEEDCNIVYPDDTFYSGFSYVTIRFSGPNVMADPEDTYAADVWSYLVRDPSGTFISSIFEKNPGLYSKEYINMVYITNRDGGEIVFSTYMRTMPGQSTLNRALTLRKTLQEEIQAMTDENEYFSVEDFEHAKTKLADQRLIDMEISTSFISNLSLWWASASTRYFLDYTQNTGRVTFGDIREYLTRYMLDKKSLLAVRTDENEFEKEQGKLEIYKFKKIDKTNAFWWSEEKENE